MRRTLFYLVIIFLSAILFLPQNVLAYDYGDLRSSTLATKAWGALNSNNTEAAIAYSQKCIDLYSDKAKEMQASLTTYASRSKNEVFSYWALNDVATALFIQGEAYRKTDMPAQAADIFNKLINEYAFGQCWDTGGWFWKPAEAAKDRIAMMESGEKFDFTDVSPPALTGRAWQAFNKNNLEEVIAYTDKCVELYGNKARKLQKSLKMPPWESEKKIHSYGILNDVGTCLFIKGEAYRNAGMTEESKEVFKQIIDRFAYSQCWDPQGWFWKPAEAAEQRLELFEDEEQKSIAGAKIRISETR